MSASGAAELLHTPDGVKSLAKTYLSIDLSDAEAERHTIDCHQLPGWGWSQNDNSTSTGPVAWLKSRLLEDPWLLHFRCGHPAEDDQVPFLFVSDPQSNTGAVLMIVPSVARSKISSSYEVICPIDIVSGRVADFGKIFSIRNDKTGE